MKVGILDGEHKGKFGSLGKSSSTLFEIYRSDPKKYYALFSSVQVEGVKNLVAVECKNLVAIPVKPA